MSDLQHELKFKGELHGKILRAILARRKIARDKFDTKRDAWMEDERLMRAYVEKTPEDIERDAKRKAGSQEFTTISIPISYALHQAQFMYQSTIFLGRNPVFGFDPYSGTGDVSAQKAEAVVQYQVAKGGLRPVMYDWLYDQPFYGVGIVGSYWADETIRVARMQEVPQTFNGYPLAGVMKKEKVTQVIPGYQGTRSYNVRPTDWSHDPAVTFRNYQQGEFCTREFDISYSEMMTGKAEGSYFNIDQAVAVGAAMQRGDTYYEDDMPDPEYTNSVETLGTGIPKAGWRPAFLHYQTLVPRDWGLGKSERPEKWAFTVVDEKVIISAQPVGTLRDDYPFDIGEYEMGAHMLFKRSMYELTQPLQQVFDWLFNSHMYNVRSTLNNRFVADPFMIRMEDLRDPEKGLVVRTRQRIMNNRPLADHIMQLPTQDITRANMADSETVMRFMQMIVGVNDVIMGMMDSGGRKSATEVRNSTTFSTSRQKVYAEYFSSTGFQSYGERILQLSQERLDSEREYKIAGDLLPGQEQTIRVAPADIANMYGVQLVDGTLPADKLALASLYKELMGLVMQDPSGQLQSQWDILGMLTYTMQMTGAKDVNRFRVNIVPDDMAREAINGGNVTPLERGTNPGTNPGGDESAAIRAQSPRQINGMGPVQ